MTRVYAIEIERKRLGWLFFVTISALLLAAHSQAQPAQGRVKDSRSPVTKAEATTTATSATSATAIDPSFTLASFHQIWKQIWNEAEILKAARLNKESAEIASERAERHWFPRLKLEGRAGTSDLGGAFLMNQLGTRKIEAADFSTQTLNSPGQTSFQQASVGIELPLYEGGSGVAASSAAKWAHDSRVSATKGTYQEVYANAVAAYMKYLSHIQALKQATHLVENADQLLKGYRLGDRSNPVGYSGWLALKSARNQLSTVVAGLETQAQSGTITLAELSGLPISRLREIFVTAQATSVKGLLAQILSSATPSGGSQEISSHRTNELRALQRASVEKIEIERARYLPQLGLFGQTDWAANSRGSGSGVTAGAYLRWSLAPTDWEVAKESRLTALAAEAQSRALEGQTVAQREISMNAAKTAELAVSLTEENQRFLEEQWDVASRLFRNGSMNAQQMADLLQRRVQVLEARVRSEQEWVQVSLQEFLTVPHQVGPAGLGSLQ